MKVEKLIHFLNSYRKTLFLTVLIVLFVLAIFIRPLPVTGDFVGFDMTQNPYLQSEKILVEDFHANSTIQLQISPDEQSISNLFTNLRELDKALKTAIPGIHTSSLLQAEELIYRLHGKTSSCTQVLERCLQYPFLSSIIAADAKSFLLFIQPAEDLDITLTKLNDIISGEHPGILTMVAMSYSHISAEIERAIRKDLILLSTLLLLITVVLVIALFRSIGALGYIFGLMILTLIPVFFILSLLKIPLSLGTVLIIPVVLIIVLADGIHLLVSYFHHNPGKSRQKAIHKSIRIFIVPSFLTSLTTALAFCSFGFSESPAIRQFGIITGLVVLLEFFITFLISPFWLNRINPTGLKTESLTTIYTFFRQFRKSIGIILILLLTGSVILLPRLKFATNYEKFFPLKSEISKAFESFKQDFHSPLSIDVILRIIKPNNDVSIEYPCLNELSDFTGDIDELKLAKRVISTASIQKLKYSMGSFGLFPDFRPDSNPYYNQEKQLYRIKIWVETMDDLHLLMEKLDSLSNSYSSVFSAQLYSDVFHFDYVNKSVATSLFRSLLLSVLLIFGVFLALSKNLFIALTSILANIIPLGVMVLIFFIWDLDLNILTSLICVVCLGLMVDDTIHILYRKIRIKSSLQKLSISMVITSMILVCGFAIHGFSSFEPTRNFGLTCAAIFLVTLVSDLVLIPWGIQLFSKKAKKSA